MIPPKHGMLATSTPMRRDRSIWESTLQSILSPVYSRNHSERRKLQSLRRGNDSGYGSPENGALTPLNFLWKEASTLLHKSFSPAREESPEVVEKRKRLFLDGFLYRLFSIRPTLAGRADPRDIKKVLNVCGSPFAMQFTVQDACVVYSAFRSLQTNCPVRAPRDDSENSSFRAVEPHGMSPEYGRRLFSRKRSSFYDVSRSEDSGVDVSFGEDSSNFEPVVGDTSESFYAPIVPQQYDILKELNKIDGYEFTSQLLSYLSPKDLQAVSSVGTAYRNIVLNDAQANQRRCTYLIERRLAKEKMLVVKSNETNEDRVLFQNLLNKLKALPQQPLADQSSNTMYNSFVEVGKKLHKNDILMKCPNCSFPSKRINGSRYCCTRKFCLYEFCRDCAAPYFDTHKCQKSRTVENVPKIVVGSLKSKRNLRRL